MNRTKTLTDDELYRQCCLYGTQARKWMKKFAALLPEVERRQLYAKYGFHSVFEFAAKLAGMNRETVLEVLRVSKLLGDKPLLQAQLAEQGWSKLRVVASIATPENEKMLVEKLQKMSKPALEAFVKEIKKKDYESVQFLPGEELSPVNPPSRVFIRLLLEPKTELRLRELQKKLSAERKVPVDFNEAVEVLLDYYDQPRKMRPVLSKETVKQELQKKHSSRYIPIKVKKILHEEYAGRCAFPGCSKLPEIYHHTRRFALNPSHDPDFLVPLCKGHERLAHLGLVENEERPPALWSLRFEPDKTSPKFPVDELVNHHRVPP